MEGEIWTKVLWIYIGAVILASGISAAAGAYLGAGLVFNYTTLECRPRLQERLNLSAPVPAPRRAEPR